jgi:signal transduction histidine kinase
MNETDNKFRTKTDESLKFERNKTDSYLDQESKSVEDESDEKVLLNRLAADKKLESIRANNDISNINPNRLTPMLDAERARSDDAQRDARAEEDRVLRAERRQKRLITEAFLENERKDTDDKLTEERLGTDQTIESNSILISTAETALVTRDQYLAIVSHDLKNPLNAISLSASTLRRSLENGVTDSPSIIKSLGIVERNVATMDRMISDLLDVERMSSRSLLINKNKHSITKLLKECKEVFSPAITNKSFTLNIISNKEEIYAEFDYDRILQVLSNLIGNALKFTPKEGTINLSVEKIKSCIEISVSDNGPGIPIEKQNEIFERFSQLKMNDRRGLGLGLFISKWIVEAHGGEIHVDNNKDKGSTFRFTLPIG